MNFNSFTYAAFLAINVALYYSLPARWRWILLLAASYYFYMSWNAKYAVLLVASTLIDYVAAILIHGESRTNRRRLYLGVSLASNLGLLFAFKYYAFAVGSLERIAVFFGTSLEIPHLNVLLPVGISFYTFQSLSYTIDVYRGDRAPERHVGLFALYVSYFPQLVAGPIERSTTLLPQLREACTFRADRFADGIKLIIWGLFKKVVVSDQMAVFVDRAYAQPWDQHGWVLLLGTYFFAFQIYCDFSGYSDIAIGSARLMGHDLMINFRRPYFSTSLTNFWRRWHVSLSTWFRDYLYFPLGGNRVSFHRSCANIMTVFVISGVWHGASWTYIIWGFIHGVILVAERIGQRMKALPVLSWLNGGGRTAAWTTRIVTFHIVLLSWVFFRASYVQDALHITTQILRDLGDVNLAAIASVWALPSVAGLLLLLGFLLAVEAAADSDDFGKLFANRSRWFRWGFYYLLLLMIMLVGKYDGKAFIYFQF